jgi:hypothetical protein
VEVPEGGCLRGSGLLELALGEIVGVDAAFGAAIAVVVHLLKAHHHGVADAGGVDRGDGADFVEPVRLRALDAHFVAAGDGHRCAVDGVAARGKIPGASLAEAGGVTIRRQVGWCRTRLPSAGPRGSIAAVHPLLPVTMASPEAPAPPVLNLELPDPDSDTISTMEFLARLEEAWAVCDRFDLQTEIWRGRILRAVRDREKRGGEGRGTGFLQWLREREISKTRAYTLIQLAESADALVGDGLLEEASVNLFSKRAFLETAQADLEVQQMIAEAANEGQEITRKQVRRLSDEFTAATSPLLPEEIRQRTAENLLPPRAVAPLVKELAKLPEEQQNDLRRVLSDEPELERVRDVTHTARWLSKAAEAALAVRAFQVDQLDFDKALQEAQRLDALGLLADAVGQAQALEAAVLKLHTSWRRLGGLQERLWVESGSSTPHLRELLTALQSLSGSTLRVSLGELAGGKRVRLQLVEESPDHLAPPPMP